MLDFAQIKEYFPPQLAAVNPKGLLVEYLQYEFLDSLFKQTGSECLSFIGGTAIRIIHDSQRFSEDLDFDNFGLNFPDFKNLLAKAIAEIKVKGFAVETRRLNKNMVYHAYIKFPNILQRLGLSSHREEKIFLSLDAQHKAKIFSPEIRPLNKFGVYRNIPVNPPEVLLSQKLMAILGRKREKGRDFYDASFLRGKTRPDYSYIQTRTGLNREIFCDKLRKRCLSLNFKALADDVKPFLFDTAQLDRVLYFRENLDQILG